MIAQDDDEQPRGKSPSAPHSFENGVEGKVCGALKFQVRANAAMGCQTWRPLPAFRSNITGYRDGLDGICGECRKLAARERDVKAAAGQAPRGRALTLAKSELVSIKGVGNVTVGWHGDAQYWPVKPLARLMKTNWKHLHPDIKDDDLLAPTIRYFVTVADDGKQREMLCLPWSHWHAFWLKFGNEETLNVQQEAQRVLAVAFGDTAQTVNENTQRVRSGQSPAMFSLRDILSAHRGKITALWEAEDDVKQALDTAEQEARAAKILREESERLEREAVARKEKARQTEEAARRRVADAERRLAALRAEIDKLSGDGQEWVYVFHARSTDITSMWVCGKFGMSTNLQQRRKALRSGNSRGDYRIYRPCDSAERVEDQTRRYCGAFGMIIGKDEFDQLPRIRYDRLIGVLEEHEYIEVEWFTRWVDTEIASSRRAAR